MPKDTHDVTTAFDRKITMLGKTPGAPAHLVDAAVYVHDTIELAKMAATSLFGDKATPELALAIYDRIAEHHSMLIELEAADAADEDDADEN